MSRRTTSGHEQGGVHVDAASSPHDRPVITFGEFRIDCARRHLLRRGQPVAIQRRPLEVLIYLASHPERVISRDELLERLWACSVNDEALTRCISILRKLLEDLRDSPRYLETVWGEGYRFIAPVSITNADGKGWAEPGAQVSGVSVRYHELGLASVAELPTSAAGPAVQRRSMRWWVLAGLSLLTLILSTFWRSSSPETDPLLDRIGVLPMIAADEGDRWVAEALSDRLVQSLSGIEGLTVVLSLRKDSADTDPDPVSAGRALNVGAVLVSRFARVEGRPALSVQLISTGDRSVLWSFSTCSESVDPEPGQIERLAVSMAKRLWARLHRSGEQGSLSAVAYRHYLRARFHWNQRSRIGLTAAIQAFKKALAIEPRYVKALEGVAESWLMLPLYGGASPTETIPKARDAAERALSIDPGAARAQAVLGVISMQYHWDWADAESRLLQAAALDPNDATAEQWLGELYCYRRQPEVCGRYLRSAAALDPLSPILLTIQGSPALFSGDFEAASTAYDQALADEPEFPLAHYFAGLSRAALGEWDQAIASYRSALPELGLAFVGGPLVYALARNGDTDGARAMLADLESLSWSAYVPPSKLAIAWLGLGDRERALALLGNAVEVRDDRLVYLAVDPHFLELHGDSSFRELAGKVGLLDVLDLPGTRFAGRPTPYPAQDQKMRRKDQDLIRISARSSR